MLKEKNNNKFEFENLIEKNICDKYLNTSRVRKILITKVFQ